MAVHPIETRYGRPEIRAIFDEETKLNNMLAVEAALARAHAAVGDITKHDAQEISKKASTQHVKLARVKEIESEIDHDVMAVVKALSEQCGKSGGYVHLGATSNDILDTALALSLKEYTNYLEEDLRKLLRVLLKLADEHKRTVCVGRTHAQHSVPMTYGLKFAIYASEVARHIERLGQCKPRLLIGKMSGAVGTGAALGKNAVKIQDLIMKDVGLGSAEVSNQIIQRDRYAEFLSLLALISQTLNKIATEIRNLQRTEIDEVGEGFGKKQVGSSTMPQKRNPIYCERICGISRIIKALAFSEFDNIPLWHERDLTNSSAERINIPECCILTDYILGVSVDVLTNLRFNPENIKRNLHMTKGLIMAEAVMIKLVEKGVSRQEAHELVRECSMEVYKSGREFYDVLSSSPKVTARVSAGELREVMKPENYIGASVERVEKVVRELGRLVK